eukprot:TRINITY_DN14647_c0_g3_i1.p1 TRINITY_DN14647_c0_g3~~TRINITY_DN14647_c0_g3_i1.p1  ORF type:complete len:311 (-),score=58.43 TRINITY_DN14647_c0_g3_i1:56-988(-)
MALVGDARSRSARDPWLEGARESPKGEARARASSDGSFGAADPSEIDLPEAVKAKQIDYKDRTQLFADLQANTGCAVEVHIPDVIDMVADLRGTTRSAMLRTAVVAWFYHALGFPVLEAACHEQSGTGDGACGMLLFRVKLDANHPQEVERLGDTKTLSDKFRHDLVAALPGTPQSSQGSGGSGTSSTAGCIKSLSDPALLEDMLHVTWTKCGSIELGGVAALGLVVLVVVAMGIGLDSRGNFCSSFCSCVSRPGRAEGDEYAAALRQLRDRGLEIEVSVDGSATLRVLSSSAAAPPDAWRWSCPECVIA